MNEDEVDTARGNGACSSWFYRLEDVAVEVVEPGALGSGPAFVLRSTEGLVAEVRASFRDARLQFDRAGRLRFAVGAAGPPSPPSTLHGWWSGSAPDTQAILSATVVEAGGSWRTIDAEIGGGALGAVYIDPSVAVVAHIRATVVPVVDEMDVPPDAVESQALPGLPCSSPASAADVGFPVFDVVIGSAQVPGTLLIQGGENDASVQVTLANRVYDPDAFVNLNFPARSRDTAVRGSTVSVQAAATEFVPPPVWLSADQRLVLDEVAVEIAYDPSRHTIQGSARAHPRDVPAVVHAFSGVLEGRRAQLARERWRHPDARGRWLSVVDASDSIDVDVATSADGEPLLVRGPGGDRVRHAPVLDLLVGLVTGPNGRRLWVGVRASPHVLAVTDATESDRRALRQLAQSLAIAGRPVEALPLLDQAASLHIAVIAGPPQTIPGAEEGERLNVLMLLNHQLRCAFLTRDYAALLRYLDHAVRERAVLSGLRSAQVEVVPARDTARTLADNVRGVLGIARTLRDVAARSQRGRRFGSLVPVTHLESALARLEGLETAATELIEAPTLTETEFQDRFEALEGAFADTREQLVGRARAVLDDADIARLVTAAQRTEREWIVRTMGELAAVDNLERLNELGRRDEELEQGVRLTARSRGEAEVFLIGKRTAMTLIACAALLAHVEKHWATRTPVSALTIRHSQTAQGGMNLSGYVERWRRRLDQDWERIGAVEQAVGFYRSLVRLLLDLGLVEEAWVAAELGRARATADLMRGGTADAVPNATSLRSAVDALGNTVVEYFLADDELVVWVVSPQGAVDCIRRTLALSELDAAVARLQVLAADHEPGAAERAEFHSLLRWLGAQLWDPLPTRLLPTAPDAVVTVIPAGPLYRVPFPALTAGDGCALLEHYTLSVLPAVSLIPDLLQRERVTTFRGPLLALVNPSPMPDEQLASLRLTEDRFPRITGLFTGERHEVHLGEAATLDRLRRPLRPPAVVMLATHAEANETDGTFVALAPTVEHDGFARPGDIVQLALPGSVVVLGACHTAGGPISGDGVDGLSRAFLVGGASALVLTLHEVAEPVALEFSYRFLEAWRDGAGVELAARHAQRALAQEEADDPALWAPFLLYGAGRTTAEPENDEGAENEPWPATPKL